MICDRESLEPSPLEELAVRLGEEHALLYRDLELERGIELSVDEAREILKEYNVYLLWRPRLHSGEVRDATGDLRNRRRVHEEEVQWEGVTQGRWPQH